MDAKVEDYKQALQDKDIEKAGSILESLNGQDLSAEQMGEITRAHDRYFADAVDDYIDEFEELMKDGEVEKAVEMLAGVDEAMLTRKQVARITDIFLKFSKEAVSSVGDMLNGTLDMEDLLNEAVEGANDEVEDATDEAYDMFN